MHFTLLSISDTLVCFYKETTSVMNSAQTFSFNRGKVKSAQNPRESGAMQQYK